MRTHLLAPDGSILPCIRFRAMTGVRGSSGLAWTTLTDPLLCVPAAPNQSSACSITSGTASAKDAPLMLSQPISSASQHSRPRMSVMIISLLIMLAGCCIRASGFRHAWFRLFGFVCEATLSCSLSARLYVYL